MSRVYLKSLDLINVGRFEKLHVEFGPGVTCLTGHHRQGKTTCIEAIKTFFAGGGAPDLVLHGQTHAEAKILWSDGQSAKKTIDLATGPDEKDTYEVEVFGPSGELKKRYAEALAERVAKGSFDPAEFLELKPRERAEFLIKRLAITFEPEEINAALESQASNIPNREVVFPPVASGQRLDLKKFNEVFDSVYESRRVVNVAIRDKEGVIASLTRTLPEAPSDGTDWAAKRDGIQAEIITVEREIAGKSSDIKAEAEQERSRITSQIEQKIADLRKQLADYLQVIDKTESDTIRDQTTELQNKKAELSLSLGQARANADRETEASGTRKSIAKTQEESKGLIVKEMRRSSILEALDKLKHKKLAKLPIEGLEIKFENKIPIITVNQTPIHKLSGQESLFLAIQCIQLSAGEYPLVLTEGDGLMTEYVQALHEACIAADPPIQVIMARHSEGGDLKVVKYG